MASKSRKGMSPEELAALRESDRVKKQASRQRKKTEEANAAIEGKSISDIWAMNEQQLLKENPQLHAELLARHEFITDLQAVAEEAMCST